MTKVKKRKKLSKQNQKNKKERENGLLLAIFLILCIVVFVLAIVMINKNSEYQKNKYDIKVPLTSEELKKGVDIEINMNNVRKNQSKEYRIQVTNYIDDEINKESKKYKIEVSLPKKDSDIDIELYSSEQNYELLEGKKKIENLRLDKNKKQTITYTLKLTQRQDETEEEYVKVVFKEEK